MHGSVQVLQVIGLGDIACGAGVHATILIKHGLLGREDQYSTGHPTDLDPRQYIQPVEHGHHQIQYHQIRLVFADFRQDLITTRRFVYLLDTLLNQYGFDCGANHRMIVRNQH